MKIMLTLLPPGQHVFEILGHTAQWQTIVRTIQFVGKLYCMYVHIYLYYNYMHCLRGVCVSLCACMFMWKYGCICMCDAYFSVHANFKVILLPSKSSTDCM